MRQLTVQLSTESSSTFIDVVDIIESLDWVLVIFAGLSTSSGILIAVDDFWNLGVYELFLAWVSVKCRCEGCGLSQNVPLSAESEYTESESELLPEMVNILSDSLRVELADEIWGRGSASEPIVKTEVRLLIDGEDLIPLS